MYEIFILSILMNFPAHAYLISKIIEPWFKISRGTLSTLLKKMLKEGYIEYTNEDIPFKSNHSSQTYKITSLGKERFFFLMLDTTESVNFIKLFHIKANNFGLLQASDILHLIQDFIKRCHRQQEFLLKQLNKFQNEFDDFDSKHLDTFKKNAGSSIKLQIEQLQTEINWAEEIKKDVNYDKSTK